MNCACCKNPCHPATAHIAGPTTVWCGPCTRDFAAWLHGHLNRRWGKMSFYASAFTPEEAVRRRELGKLSSSRSKSTPLD